MTELIIAGVVGGVFTIASSLIAYSQGKKKNNADVEKTNAETNKTNAETELLRVEIGAEKLELIERLMEKIDAMQEQIDEMQITINNLEFKQCKGDLCPTNIEYKKIIDKREARKAKTKDKKLATNNN